MAKAQQTQAIKINARIFALKNSLYLLELSLVEYYLSI